MQNGKGKTTQNIKIMHIVETDQLITLTSKIISAMTWLL